MILSLHTLVEAFECLLNAPGLFAVGIMEHHPNRFVFSVTDNLNARVFLGDVIAICG